MMLTHVPVATLWQIHNSRETILPMTLAALQPHSWSAIRGLGMGRFSREGIMDTDRLWDIQVNWTRFFDTGLLVTGAISVASVALQLI